MPTPNDPVVCLTPGPSTPELYRDWEEKSVADAQYDAEQERDEEFSWDDVLADRYDHS